MHHNKYLLVCCCALILLAVTIRYSQSKDLQQALRLYEPVVRSLAPPPAPQHIDNDVLITDDGKHVEILQEQKAEKAPAVIKPYISAESYLIGNLKTGEIYVSHNASSVFPIASVSKLYTALVVEHAIDTDETITITQPMLDAYGDAGKLVLDEKYSPKELLYPLLLESSNDAAEAYAQSFGYEDFIAEMNGFAGEIGMANTSFKDASGLSPSNKSNAEDLFVLSQYLYKHEKDILSITREKTKEVSTTTDHVSHTWVNINPYAFYKDFLGGKTGRTDEAKESMVSLFNQEVNGKSYPIAIIILRSDFGEREIDTDKLVGMFMELPSL